MIGRARMNQENLLLDERRLWAPGIGFPQKGGRAGQVEDVSSFGGSAGRLLRQRASQRKTPIEQRRETWSFFRAPVVARGSDLKNKTK